MAHGAARAPGRRDLTVDETDTVDHWLASYHEHMIQETARHAGHADIIRETLGGTRGI